jgi:hypothetical protein
MTETHVRFPLGRIVATPGALDALARNGTSGQVYLARHASGDWGDLGDEDKAANDEALNTGGRLFSAYLLPDGTKVWIISEADRSSTCILLPEEY